MSSDDKCSLSGGACFQTMVGEMSHTTGWPHQLDPSVLPQHPSRSNPMGQGFDSAEEFRTLRLNALFRDLKALMKDSQNDRPTSAIITGAAEEPPFCSRSQSRKSS